MKTTVQEEDKKYSVRLEGELDTTAAVEVDKILQPLYKNNGKDIFIECEKLKYISSSGLRILSRILKATRASGGTVTVMHVNDDIMNVFRLTGFSSLFHFV